MTDEHLTDPFNPALSVLRDAAGPVLDQSGRIISSACPTHD